MPNFHGNSDPVRTDLDFTYHAPRDPETIEAHEAVNAFMLRVARELDNLLHGSREKSLVMTKLQEARMWANACVAIQGAQR